MISFGTQEETNTFDEVAPSKDAAKENKASKISSDTKAPIVRKIILTDEERKTLISLKNMGNMSQVEAMEYHRLMNAEDGISGRVIVQERRLKELEAKDKPSAEEDAVKAALLKLDEKAKAKQDADEALVKAIADEPASDSPVSKAQMAVDKAQEEVAIAEKAVDVAESKVVVV